jgi:hypothetical protein
MSELVPLIDLGGAPGRLPPEAVAGWYNGAEELVMFGGYRTLTVCTLGVRDRILLRETFNGNGAP